MPRPRRARAAAGKQVETLRHEQETRANIPTAEYQALVREDTESPLRVACQRRTTTWGWKSPTCTALLRAPTSPTSSCRWTTGRTPR